jgi:hypothetical protein
MWKTIGGWLSVLFGVCGCLLGLLLLIGAFTGDAGDRIGVLTSGAGAVFIGVTMVQLGNTLRHWDAKQTSETDSESIKG